MTTLILYDSVFGNTEQIAQTMGQILGESTIVKKVSEATLEDLNGVDLLVVGSPTRAFKPTEGIVNFLKNLPAGMLKGIPAAAFDTRIPPESISSKILRNLVAMGGYAVKTISKLLKSKGATVLPSEGFFVTGTEGPLVIGEVKRAADWIKQTAQSN